MSQKLPRNWQKITGADTLMIVPKRDIKRHTTRQDRRHSKAELHAYRSGKTVPYATRLTEVAHKAIAIHSDYAEASYFSYAICPDGYGDSYLADREDRAIQELCDRYGFTVEEVESEVMRLCYEEDARHDRLENYA